MDNKTLYFKLSVIFITGLIAFIGIGMSAWLFLIKQEEHYFKSTMITKLTNHVGDLTGYLKELPYDKRVDAILTLNRDPYKPVKYSLRSDWLDTTPIKDADLFVNDFKTMLNHRLETVLDLRYGTISETRLFQLMEAVNGKGDHDHLNLMMFEPFGDPFIVESDATIFTVQIKLDQQQVFSVFIYDFFEHYSIIELIDPEQLVFVCALLLVIMALTFLAVRQVTHPLARLSSITESLGENIVQNKDFDMDGPREVVKIAYALKEMQQKIVAQIKEQTQVYAAMSHDFKTPLTRLRLRIELLDTTDTQQKLLADIDQLEYLVRESLEYARGTAITDDVKLLDLNSLLSSTIEDLAVSGKSVLIKGTATTPVKGQPHQWKRCFANLLKNALFYGNQVEVWIDEDLTNVTVRVVDDGPGIPQNELEKVLKPYYRLARERNKETGGSGLGLAIVQKIVETHQGTISLTNRRNGQGLIATVTCPKGPV